MTLFTIYRQNAPKSDGRGFYQPDFEPIARVQAKDAADAIRQGKQWVRWPAVERSVR